MLWRSWPESIQLRYRFFSLRNKIHRMLSEKWEWLILPSELGYEHIWFDVNGISIRWIVSVVRLMASVWPHESTQPLNSMCLGRFFDLCTHKKEVADGDSDLNLLHRHILCPKRISFDRSSWKSNKNRHFRSKFGPWILRIVKQNQSFCCDRFLSDDTIRRIKWDTTCARWPFE